MKKREIEQMKAGREIDESIAKKIMGYHETHVEMEAYDYRSGVHMQQVCVLTKGPGSGFICHYQIPAYSTDISMAWGVVENMEAKGYLFRITRMGTVDPPGSLEWQVDFRKLHSIQGADLLVGNAPTAPLAICRAALLIYENECQGKVTNRPLQNSFFSTDKPD